MAVEEWPGWDDKDEYQDSSPECDEEGEFDVL